jgi:hypothetical protein
VGERRLAEARQSLRDEHIPFDEKIPFGIMLEVPSVMFIIDQCCEEIDFFSIGSNDLTQYLLAVDRDNSKVTRHYNSLRPFARWTTPCRRYIARGNGLACAANWGRKARCCRCWWDLGWMN